jgi:UDPglucose--hexose-1-phosphate uridylyltransferase
MKIEFKKYSRVTRFLDPSTGFQANERPTEIRVDPLTGQTARVLYFPIRMLTKPDLTEIVERSLQFGCPFCPQMLEMVTPKFPPEITEKERIKRGSAVIFPNMFPYDTHSAVAIFSEEHFKPLDSFEPELLRDGFCVSQEYLAASLQFSDNSSLFNSINWNYMPLAGGSIIHPHLQIIAGESGTNYHLAVLKASGEYTECNGSSYWLDLIEEESSRGERFLGKSGPISWITSFSPKGFIDFTAIFERAGTIMDITESDWLDFSRGLCAAMKFLDSKGFYSFNMAIYSGTGEDHFRTHAKMIPRTLLPPMDTSDINYFNTLHNEVLTIFKPEEICADARAFFHELR